MPFKTRDTSQPRRSNHHPISLPCTQSLMHTSTFPRQEAGERGSENPTPGHPDTEAEQRLYSELQGQNNKHCPTASGDSKSGHQLISRFGAQFEERGCSHTTTHTHTRDFTNPPLPYRLPPRSHTKCILPTSPLPSPLFLPESHWGDEGS